MNDHHPYVTAGRQIYLLGAIGLLIELAGMVAILGRAEGFW